MSYLLFPSTLQEEVGVELDPALCEAAARLSGWTLRASAAEEDYPRVNIADPSNGQPTAADAAILAFNEYIACEADTGTWLYLSDGYVQFPQNDASAWVYSYPQNHGGPPPLPTSALETALFRALLLQETLLVHALVFSFRGRGLLVLGSSGAGKTTLGLAALAAGAAIVSDDRVALRLDNGRLRAYGMRPFLHIRNKTLQDMVSATPVHLAPHHKTLAERTIVDCSVLGDGHTESTIITDLLVLAADAESRPVRSQIGSISQAEGYATLIGSSLPYLFALSPACLGTNPAALALHMLEHVPSFRLRVGTNLMRHPADEIDAILGALAISGD